VGGSGFSTATITGASISNGGTLKASNTTLRIVGNTAVTNTGTLVATAGNFLEISGNTAVTNSGTVLAAAGTLVELYDSVTNTGGTIEAAAGARILLDRPTGDPQTITGGSIKTLNGGFIGTAGFGGVDTITGASISNNGTLQAFLGSTLKIVGSFSNAGVLDGSDGGDLVVTGSVTGTGNAIIHGNGEIEFGAASNQNVTFAAGFTSDGGILQLDKAESYTGKIAGLSPSVPNDVVDLRDISFTGVTDNYVGNTSSGVLTISDGTTTAHLKMIGNFTTASFNLSDDGTGRVRFSDPSAPMVQAMAAFGAPQGSGTLSIQQPQASAQEVLLAHAA
jgi:hypothetical protein